MSYWNSSRTWVVYSMFLVALAVHAAGAAGAESQTSRCDSSCDRGQACDADAQRKAAQKEMTAAQARYREVLKKLNAANAKVNELRAKADPLFKASQPYRKAELEVAASMKNMQTVHREEVDKVRKSEAYRKVKSEHDPAAATAKRLLDKVDIEDPTLQAALKVQLNTASAMANMEAQVVLTNARYLEAAAKSKAAEKQRDDARKTFDAEQEKKPEFAAALKAQADAEREAKAAEKAAQDAQEKFEKTIRP